MMHLSDGILLGLDSPILFGFPHDSFSHSRIPAFRTHGPGIDEPLTLERDLNSNGTFEFNEAFHYRADGLGSVTALTDVNRAIVEKYDYTSFGTPTLTGPGLDGFIDTPDDVTLTQSAFGNPYTYTGREADPESDLYYYRARSYNPQIGKFIQEDPVGISGAELSDPDFNQFIYTRNNPINFTDPRGLTSISILTQNNLIGQGLSVPPPAPSPSGIGIGPSCSLSSTDEDIPENATPEDAKRALEGRGFQCRRGGKEAYVCQKGRCRIVVPNPHGGRRLRQDQIRYLRQQLARCIALGLI